MLKNSIRIRIARAMGEFEKALSRRDFIRKGLAALPFLLTGGIILNDKLSRLPASRQSTTGTFIEFPNPQSASNLLEKIPSPPAFQAGVSILAYGNYDRYIENGKRIIEQIIDLNANSLAINFPFYQENIESSEIYLDPQETPSLDKLAILTKEAHGNNLSVMLRPILDESGFNKDKEKYGTTFRGDLMPKDVKGWFKSYGRFINRLAVFSQENRIEILSIAAELESMQKHPRGWVDLIKNEIKPFYKGALTSCLNWRIDSYDISLEVTPLLDYIGVDCFFPFPKAPPNPTVEELNGSDWDYWKRTIKERSAKYGKPVLFTEVGYPSEVDSYKAPYGWPSDRPADWDLQRREYEALFQSGALDLVPGMYVWEFALDKPLQAPLGDNGFDVRGKPAERVIQKYYQTLKG